MQVDEELSSRGGCGSVVSSASLDNVFAVMKEFYFFASMALDHNLINNCDFMPDNTDHPESRARNQFVTTLPIRRPSLVGQRRRFLTNIVVLQLTI